MKRYLPYLVAGGVIIAGSVAAFLIFGSDDSNKNNNDIQKSISLDLTTSLCDQIPSSVVQAAIGKNIVSTTPHTSSTTNVCEYNTDQTNFVTLRLNALSYENQKNGQISLGRTITTNPSINTEHFIAMQENGLINDIVLKLNANLFLAVDRTSGSTFSEENMIQLAAGVANYLASGSNSTADSNTQDSQNVSTIDDEEFINNFFTLIDNGEASDAVMVMSVKNTTDDSTKQAWGVQFNSITSVKVTSIKAWQQDSWTSTSHQYKVVLNMAMSPNSASAPIPYYGYENGQNIRWINLVKESGAWRVDGIATGP